ncbi:glycerophosphodiester phosphodiesterase family protein [Nibrella viscosa]|uniref:Glycerophosphodiester phosphodiesterase family protein n=1 Tax=Nibrella viscosa TaxID=1084524 RepID=A0ABP8KJ19_9BACT
MHLCLLFFVLATHALAQNPSYDLQGHRGCRGLMPENSLPAFLKALDLGVSTLEMDVVISQDRQVVVSHDPYMNADFCLTPAGAPIDKKEQKKLNLYQMTYAEIRQYDCGSMGNVLYPEQQKQKVAKPLLRDVIQQAEAYRKQKNLPPVSYNIEIKSEADQYDISQPKPAEFSNLVYKVIIEQLPPEQVILQSFDFDVLKHWKQQIDAGIYKKVRLSALVANLKSIDTHLKELGFVPDVYSPNYQLLSKDKITRLHEKGMKVIPWTVNNVNDMRRLLNNGVDGLITDYPDRALNL